MNNQKDNNTNNKENKAIELNSGIKPANYFNVFDHNIYVDLAKRSSKIVTALYMVTDFLDTHDPLRDLVRGTMTTIMQKLFTLTHAHKTDRVEMLSDIDTMLYANISYLDVIYQNGFVSQMNYDVIAGEMNKLRRTINAQIKKSLPYDKKINNTTSVKNFTFSNKFFDQSTLPERNIKDINDVDQSLKDIDLNVQSLEKTFKKKNDLAEKTKTTQTEANESYKEYVSQVKKQSRIPKINEVKEERKENILKILKQKRNASINDICALFKDCSSKTIQRDLMELIDQGLVKKEGSRRWSKYNLTY